MRMELNFEVMSNMTQIILRLHEQNLIQLLGHAGYPRDIWSHARQTAEEASRKRLALMKRGSALAD